MLETDLEMDEQQIEFPGLGDARDFVHHRPFHVGGEGAVGAPPGPLR